MGNIDLLASEVGVERIKFDENLKYHTFNKVEVRTSAFYIATNENELIRILNLADELKIPFKVLGNGTKFFWDSKKFDGLIIKNRNSIVKTLAVKGKVGRAGIGVEEAVIEAGSGTSLQKLNQYLSEQKLQTVKDADIVASSIGGAIFLDSSLRNFVENIRVWVDGEIQNLSIEKLKIRDHIVISASFKFKAVE